MRARRGGWIGPAAGVMVGLWLTAAAWGPGPPAGDDVMALVVRLEDGLRVLGGGRLDGWSSSFLTGHPQFLHYGPGLAVVAGLLRVLSFGQLSVEGALSVLFVLAFVAVVPAVWFLARSLGAGRQAASTAGVLALAVSSPYGVGLAGLYETGLVTHSLAAPFVLVAVGAAVRAVGEPERRRWPALLAVALAVVVVTHVLSMLIAPVLIAAFIAVAVNQPRKRRWWPTIGLAAAGTVGLSAFWLWPYVRHLGERGDVTVWATPSFLERAGEILTGRILFPTAWFAWLVVAGWVWVLARGRRSLPLMLATVVAPIGFLLLAHGLYAWFPRSEIGLQLANRGLGYVGLVAVIPAGALLAEAATRVAAMARRVPDPMLATAVAALIVLAASGPLRSPVGHQGRALTDLAATAETLRRVVPVHARFAMERQVATERSRFGVAHPDFWLAARSGRNTLNTFGVELTASPEVRFLTEFLTTGHELVDTSIPAFARHGVTHIVTVVPETTRRLLTDGTVRVVAEHGALTVLGVLAPPGQPKPESLLTVDDGTAAARVAYWRDGGEVLAIAVDSSTLSAASLAIGWSPAWKATLDGHAIPVLRRADGLIGVTLPGGHHDLVVRYQPTRADSLGQLVSVVTFIVGLWWLRPRRSKVPAG